MQTKAVLWGVTERRLVSHLAAVWVAVWVAAMAVESVDQMGSSVVLWVDPSADMLDLSGSLSAALLA